MKILKSDHLPENSPLIYLLKDISFLPETLLTHAENEFIILKAADKKKTQFQFNRFTHQIWVQLCKDGTCYADAEHLRKNGDSAAAFFKDNRVAEVTLYPLGLDTDEVIAFAEGFSLGSYQFLHYRTAHEKNFSIETLTVCDPRISEHQIQRLQNVVDACFKTRDLVNEPANKLDAVTFSERIAHALSNTGINTTIIRKNEMDGYGMTGLLTVNKGSQSEPTFLIMEWKPENATHSKPVVLVGKGLVYDTGGINLKPTSGLDTMKSDMAGGAAVFGALYALATNKVPIHVIGLVPATDNRPGENAMVPGDIITMGNGKTVEIVNTDAEGRLILADALLYATRYDPRVVIDMATLTGAAQVALGRFGIAAMHHDASQWMNRLKESSMRVYERVVEFPFWDEYGQEIESDIADIRNLGKGRGGGIITAGKFLAHFISYPWIHLDIAAMAFMESRESYLGKGGTGVGVRLLYDLLERESVSDTTGAVGD